MRELEKRGEGGRETMKTLAQIYVPMSVYARAHGSADLAQVNKDKEKSKTHSKRVLREEDNRVCSS